MQAEHWAAIAAVAIAEGLVFQFQPELGWAFVLALIVAALQAMLQRDGD
ncbi:MAG: hypothetical protein ACRDTH_05815 [Pseudonocardiaceae bacterium]